MPETEKLRSPEISVGSSAPKVERPLTPEQSERPAASRGMEIPIQTAVTAPSSATPADSSATAAGVKSQQLADIERILEEDLSDLYFRLPDEKKVEFRRKGEETAAQIALLLSAAKVKVTKIVSLIRDWLKLIPGINRLFLEQEAKIKADHLLKLNNRE